MIISRVAGWKYGPRPFGPKEIDRLLVPPCKAFTLLTDHLITGIFLDAMKSWDMNVAGNWDVSIQKFSYDVYIVLHHYIFRVKKSKIQNKLKTQCAKHLNVAPRHQHTCK